MGTLHSGFQAKGVEQRPLRAKHDLLTLGSFT